MMTTAQMAEKKIIYIVEDSLADVKLMKMAFSEQPLEADFKHFADGQEFLDFLESEKPEKIDLITLDLNMPRMGGIDILKALQNNPRYKKLPIIIFSSSTHETDVQTCYDLGANAYVSKPIDIMKFSETIAAISGFWGSFNISPFRSEEH